MNLRILLWLLPCLLMFVSCKKKNPEKYQRRAFNALINEDFMKLEGKETSLWEHIKRYEDFENLVFFEHAYNALFHEQFKRAEKSRIPYVFHFIWLGPKNFPIESIDNIRHWKKYHPLAKFKFWTDRERIAPVKGMQVCLLKDFKFSQLAREYEESDNWAEKADLLRFEILKQEGGVYVDHDADCMREFNGLINNYDFFAALEPPHAPIGEHAITIGIGIIGSIAKHPLIEETIQCIGKRWQHITAQFDERDIHEKAQRVMHRTYLPLTLVAEKAFKTSINRNIILPANYFYPSKFQKACLYSKHYYGTSWNYLGASSKAKRYYYMSKPFLQFEAETMRYLIIFFIVSVLITGFTIIKLLTIKGASFEKR